MRVVALLIAIPVAVCAYANAQNIGHFETPFNHRNDGVHKFSDGHWSTMGQRPGCGTKAPFTNCDQPYFNALHVALISQDAKFTKDDGTQESLRGRVLAWNYPPIWLPPIQPPTQWSQGYTWWSIMDPEPLGSSDSRYRFMNFTYDPLPVYASRAADLACAGHTWLEDGRLFVAGGTEKYPDKKPSLDGSIIGARLTFIFDPALAPLPGGDWNDMWVDQGPTNILEGKRWYPTCTLMSNGWVLVAGGHLKDNWPQSVVYEDDYEVWNTQSGSYEINVAASSQLFDGPEAMQMNPLAGGRLYVYPRIHLLTTGQTFMGGMEAVASSLWHDAPAGFTGWGPQLWNQRGWSGQDHEYGSSVLYPNINGEYNDVVMITGGRVPDTGELPVAPEHPGASQTGWVYHDKVQLCRAGSSSPGCFSAGGYNWTGEAGCDAVPAMNYRRAFHNAVLLPDASVLVVGGQESGPPNTPVNKAELWNGAEWQVLAEADLYIPPSAPAVPTQPTSPSPRMYHSTAILLPSGKVLVAGGDERFSDYEIFVPPYLEGPESTRPKWVSVAPTLEPTYFGAEHYADYTIAPGSSVTRVVLMRPASLTHHSCSDQRYVQLEIMDNPPGWPANRVRFRMPPAKPGTQNPSGTNLAPPGYYMCFLVSNAGVPSVARWVLLQ